MAELTYREMEDRGLIEPGHMFRCSRAEKAHKDGRKPAEFLGETDKRRDDWHTAEWTDKNGIVHHMLLCPECYEKYLSALATHQRDMYQFENEGIY